MPHIHTDPNDHDWTVTAYIVRTDLDTPKALLHMHRKLNMLLPVGGHVETNESPWQAIAHELREESGYALSQLHIVQPPSRVKHMSKVVQHPYPLSMNTHYIPDNHLHTDIEYGFITESDPEHPLHDSESNDLRWLTLDEIMAVPPSEIFQNTREVYIFLINEALEGWDRVDTNSFLMEHPEDYKHA